MAARTPDADVVSIKTGRRTSPMKGRKQTEAQRKATTAGRAKARENARRDQEAKAKGVPLRSHLLLSGDLTVKDLDDEELFRMRCRDRAGGWAANMPDIPLHLARQMQRELLDRAIDKMKRNVGKATDVIIRIMEDQSVKPEVRLKAALSLLERGLGKVPERLDVTGSAWDETFEDIILKVKQDREEAG